MSLVLYEMVLSPVSGRVRFALELKGLSYTSRLHTPMVTDLALRRIAPKVMVPTLVHDGRVIQDSDRILEHLEALAPEPALLGRDADERAAIRGWLERFHELMPLLRTDVVARSRAELEPYSRETPLGFLPAPLRTPLARIALERFARKWACDETERPRIRARVHEVLTELPLEPGRPLVGDRLSDADIAMAELSLLLAPPGPEWLAVGPEHRRIYTAGWLEPTLAARYVAWRDALYAAHRRPLDRRSGPVGATSGASSR